MLTFRKKILVSDCILFFTLLLFLLPFVEHTVRRIMHQSLEKHALEVIKKLDAYPNWQEMIAQHKPFALETMTLFNQNGQSLSSSFIPSSIPVEVETALKHGKGSSKRKSLSSGETFFYIAIRFDKNQETYVLRIGFPSKEIDPFIMDFKIGFFLLGTFLLMLYTLITWIILHRLSRPIQQIAAAITPYKTGQEEFLPQIKLHQSLKKDEFDIFVTTFNLLSEKIQKQIEHVIAERKERESILEALGEGIIALDTKGKIIFINTVSLHMLGISKESALNFSFNQIQTKNHDLVQKCHELVLETLQTSEKLSKQWRLDQGNPLFIQLIATPRPGQTGVILVLQDKTSDHKMLEIGKEFIANASHELRTPLTILRGFAETLQDFPNLSKKTLSEIGHKIVRTSTRLDGLIKSLLMLSNIENASKQTFKPIPLIPLLKECKTLLLSAYPEVTVQIQSSGIQPTVVSDSHLLELAIMNVLENGVKYSSRPAELLISLQVKNEWVEIHIQDQGIGIPAEEISRIFDRFYTVDKARSRKSGGAGLGLSIVKTIIQKHHGMIRVYSIPKEGSTFILSLPLASPLPQDE